MNAIMFNLATFAVNKSLTYRTIEFLDLDEFETPVINFSYYVKTDLSAKYRFSLITTWASEIFH